MLSLLDNKHGQQIGPSDLLYLLNRSDVASLKGRLIREFEVHGRLNHKG